MSQTWSDTVPDSANNWDSDLSTMQSMFASIKSCFSGSSAPSNTVAGMIWYDTTNHVLWIRNEANTDWIGIWDLANNKPYGQDFTDGSYLDGDKIDIDFTPANYTPDASIAEANDVDDLAAHLKGLDAVIQGLNATEAGDVVLHSSYSFDSYGSSTSSSWTKAVGLKVWVPSWVNSISSQLSIKTSNAGYPAYATIRVGSTYASAASTTSLIWTWVQPGDLTSGFSTGTWIDLDIVIHISSGMEVDLNGWTIIGKP